MALKITLQSLQVSNITIMQTILDSIQPSYDFLLTLKNVTKNVFVTLINKSNHTIIHISSLIIPLLMHQMTKFLTHQAIHIKSKGTVKRTLKLPLQNKIIRWWSYWIQGKTLANSSRKLSLQSTLLSNLTKIFENLISSLPPGSSPSEHKTHYGCLHHVIIINIIFKLYTSRKS